MHYSSVFQGGFSTKKSPAKTPDFVDSLNSCREAAVFDWLSIDMRFLDQT